MNIDLVMTANTVMVSYAMIPQIIKSIKEKNVGLAWQTLILSTIGCWVFVGCFAYLGLKVNTCANVLIATAWSSLVVMKIIFKGK
jgi:uncharacterized protein with PQ loop repeat